MDDITTALICNLFDYAIYFLLIKNLTTQKKNTNHALVRGLYSFICFTICQIICLYFTNIHNNPVYMFLIEFLAVIIILYIYFRPVFIEFIVGISLTYFFLFITQIIYAVAVSLLGFSLANNWIHIIACIVTLTTAIIITGCYNLNKITALFCNTHKIGAIALIGIFSISVTLSFYFKLDTVSFTESIIFVLIAVLFILMIITISTNQLITISNMTKNLNAYNQYMPMLDELILSVRQRQHNHINEIQSIIGLMHTHKDYDSLTEAMKITLSAFESDTEPEYLLKLNLLLVSGFLYQKQCYARKIGRNIHFVFETYELHTVVPEYELIEMFGILIDNSLEAANLNETITVFVNSYQNKIEFTTKNSGHILTNEEYTDFFAKGYSVKPESAPNKKYSGLGLYALRELVLIKYKGNITLWNEDSDILLKIIV